MVKPVSEKSDRPQAYQQALDDFGITKLMSHLSNYTDADFKAELMNLEKQELENLAAILIQWLTKNVKGQQIASYLNAIRHGDFYVLCDPTILEIPPPSIDLPANFPNGVTPRYKEGDRVRWRLLTNNTDWGIVIGRYYTYAPQRGGWAVCYLIRLDKDSPSAAWTVSDTAWEEDLEAIADNDWEQEVGAPPLCPPPRGEIGSSGDGESFLPNLGTNQQATLHPIPDLSPPATISSSSLNLPTLSPCAASSYQLRRFANAIMPKSLHMSPGTYSSGGRDKINPRTLTQREHQLIELYSNCQLAMTPMKFYSRGEVTYEHIASICSRSTSTVQCWFIRASNSRRPTPTDLRHLAIMNFLLDHFEEIPSQLRNLLCPANSGQEKIVRGAGE
jgi:hypothetical protein